MYFMDANDASIVRHRILDLLIRAQEDGMPVEIVHFVEGLIDLHMCTVKSLQEYAQLGLWKAVGRRMSVIRSMHMPKAFVKSIASLFNLDLE